MNTLTVILAQISAITFFIGGYLRWKKYNSRGVEYNFQVWEDASHFFAAMVCALIIWEWFLGVI